MKKYIEVTRVKNEYQLAELARNNAKIFVSNWKNQKGDNGKIVSSKFVYNMMPEARAKALNSGGLIYVVRNGENIIKTDYTYKVVNYKYKPKSKKQSWFKRLFSI